MIDTYPLDGAGLIAQERARQLTEEGYTPEHDDKHDRGEMALAAALYATSEPLFRKHDHISGPRFYNDLPWAGSDKRPCLDGSNVLADPRIHTAEQRLDLLVKAGAMIAAEIDRIKRLDSESEENNR